MKLTGTVLTFDLGGLSEEALGHVLALATQAAGENRHLAAGVPEEYFLGLEREAEAWERVSAAVRARLSKRAEDRKALCAKVQAIIARREQGRIVAAPAPAQGGEKGLAIESTPGPDSPPARLSWSEMERRYVGGKYRGRGDIPGLQVKTLRVVDVNLGGDVAVSYRGSGGRPIISQPDFLAWVKTATVLEEPGR